MECDQNPVTLGAYLDGELPAERASSVRDHIGSCPKCAAELADLVIVQRGLRPARGLFTPSAEFRRRVARQVEVPRRRPLVWRMIPATILAAAVLLVAVAWTLFPRRSNDFAEVADMHVSALASANPVDVVSTDRHTVKPWFQGKIPFSFNVPELAGTEFNLVGGRLVYFHQSPGAQLIVAMRQHKISVFIFQDSPEMESAFSVPGVRHRNAFSVETWQSQGLRFFVIGDAEPAGIEKLAKLLKAANQSSSM
jgi:anti-sigma factor RsiW